MAAAGYGLFNAVAFAGAGFLFSKLNKRGYEEEIKRHNMALEALAKAKETFYENETRRRDRQAALRQEIADAKADGKVTSEALRALSIELSQNQESRQKEPELSDFYRPSSEMQGYEHIIMAGMGLGGGYLVTRILF